MFLKQFLAAGLAALLFSAGAARADEASVGKAMEAFLGVPKVDGVKKTPYLGLYEVRVAGEIIYTDEKVSHIITGNIIETKTRTNLTQERLNKLSAIKFSDLPLELAVKTVRGDGKRVIATFEDPNCTYCKKLAHDLQNVNNITVYTFLLPILSADSAEKSKAIWCSADRTKAWNELMLNNTAPVAGGACEAPNEKVLALGQKLNVRGTPTIFLANGDRIPGAVSAGQLEEMLKKIAAK